MTDTQGVATELRVRLILSSDALVDACIFPLASHASDSPIDTLAGFLNKRRHEFFLVRLPDGSEVLFPLARCYVFELSHKVERQIREENPGISAFEEVSNPAEVVSYAPVVLTLTTGRMVRGDMWFYAFEDEEHRNVAAGLNREQRYVCVHGEHSTVFVRRDAILKAQLTQSGADAINATVNTHPDHVTRESGLIDLSEFADMTAVAAMEAREERDEAPPPTGSALSQDRPQAPLSGKQRGFIFAPKSPPKPQAPGAEADPPEDDGPQGVDERFWY